MIARRMMPTTGLTALRKTKVMIDFFMSIHLENCPYCLAYPNVTTVKNRAKVSCPHQEVTAKSLIDCQPIWNSWANRAAGAHDKNQMKP
jgi:hypothetical protein